MQRELGQHIKERSFAHKHLVDTKRRLEETLLDPVLQARECFSGIELATRNVRPAGDRAARNQLKAPFCQSTFPTAWGSHETETPLFTSHIQSELLDIALPLLGRSARVAGGVGFVGASAGRGCRLSPVWAAGNRRLGTPDLPQQRAVRDWAR